MFQAIILVGVPVGMFILGYVVGARDERRRWRP